MKIEEINDTIFDISKRARSASFELMQMDRAVKDRFLIDLAKLIDLQADVLSEENRKDIEAAFEGGLAKPMIERLTFTPERIVAMATGVREIAGLEDPVGRELERKTRPNGLEIIKRQVPIGVIGIIYESRPNVTIDCAALCFKSGNAVILRGGKEAFHSNRALMGLIHQALKQNGINPDSIQMIPTTDRHALNELLKMDAYIHCIIPRGGESLIRFVAENSRIPVIKHYKGVCNIYVDSKAEPEMARSIVLNAKTQRVSVCNAAENLFIHQEIAQKILPSIASDLIEKGVELRVDDKAAKILKQYVPIVAATEEDFYTEYADYVISIKIVASLQEAISCVNRYGSGHSEAIISADKKRAEHFLCAVDSATVYWNASTRFTDGFEFGLGAEIGISTDRLHARGPMGVNELCTYKFIVLGKGQVRS